MSIQTAIFRSAAGDPALEITRDFFRKHDEAMLNAAAMLGGPAAHHRCLRLLANIAESDALSKALKHELVWLHRLVTLDFVGDPESEETARFAAIDLLDPRVEEICLEADQLFELLVAIAGEDPTCEIVRSEIMDLFAA